MISWIMEPITRRFIRGSAAKCPQRVAGGIGFLSAGGTDVATEETAEGRDGSGDAADAGLDVGTEHDVSNPDCKYCQSTQYRSHLPDLLYSHLRSVGELKRLTYGIRTMVMIDALDGRE